MQRKLTMFIFAIAVLTANAAEFDLNDFKRKLTSQDFEDVERLLTLHEATLKNVADYTVYARQVLEISTAIVDDDEPQLSDKRFEILVRTLASLFEKSHTLNPREKDQVAWITLKRSQADRLRMLCHQKCLGPVNQPQYKSRRNRVMRLIGLFFAEINSNLAIVSDDALPSVNIAPPLNKGNETLSSGMDPKDIKDPDSRAAYEGVISENEALIKRVKIQRFCRNVSASSWKQTREDLIRVYSENPDMYELFDFLVLMNTKENERTEILLAVAKASKVEVPYCLQSSDGQ